MCRHNPFQCRTPRNDPSPQTVIRQAKFLQALMQLLEAREYAQQTACNVWEFAVEIDQLLAWGVTYNDLRWLVRLSLVEHQREVTNVGENGRAFHPTGDLTFTDRSCFVLTECGVEVARENCQSDSFENSQPSSPQRCMEAIYALVERKSPRISESDSGVMMSRPRWDAERRELVIGGVSVKQFKWRAVNQEMVLAAFEEEGWPRRIDDPLPPRAEQDSKRRLSDTIKCLNRKQNNRLLHFRGDGTGEGVTWELTGPNGSANELND